MKVNADMARKLCEEANNMIRRLHDEKIHPLDFDQIDNKIIKAAKKGLNNIKIYQEINNSDIEELKKNGYKVCDIYNIFGFSYSQIEW